MWPRAPPGRKWIYAKVAKIAVFEPRPTEARTFIFLYEITPILLNGLHKVLKAPLRGVESAN